MSDTIDISEIDCVYLSYDEPRADEFWAKIQSQVPWAKRVHNVKGSDAAHKAAAAASDTERFILIDGDNLPNWEFFNQQLRITEINKESVFRWRAINEINGLTYGNGGISCWTRDFINTMRTHESTDGSDDTVVEFCFDNRYWAMHDVWSYTYPNQSQYHAWRAGFREGVKMCLDQGRRPTPEEFDTAVWYGNKFSLEVWCTLGRDVEYGEWAIYGARYGAYKCMFEDSWDYTEVRDFDKLNEIYQNILPSEAEKNSEYHASILTNRLGLNIVEVTADQSSWIKKHNQPWKNIDIMLPERDYVRVINETARQLWR
jgi:hypothetical protein